MKIIAFLLIIIPAQIFSNEKTVSHDIEKVTVFLNNAEITRLGTTNIPSGKSDMFFEGISSRILNQGLKISISNDVKVFSVNIKTNEKIITENESFKASEMKIKEFNKAKSLVEINLKSLKKEIQYLEANMNIGGNNGASFSQINDGAIYFREKINEIQKKIYDKKIDLKELKIAEKKILKEHKKLIERLNKTNTTLKITVISNVATNCQIELKYLVSNALWVPKYSIRANDQSKTIKIEYQAQIYNNTGNDWKNKPITLAILDSSDDIVKPEMKVWTLENDNSNYSYSKKHSQNQNNYQKQKGVEKQEFNVIQVDNLSTRFQIKDLHLIPADATPHLIDIAEYTKDVEYYTLSIPKVKNGAFKIARIIDWESLGLLDGLASLYYNDTYQGVSTLNTQQLNDTLDISLGKENSFNISRIKLASKSRINLIGTNIKEVTSYEIIVKNNKNVDASIQIKDQIPVSTSNEIEVKALEVSNGQIDFIDGEVSWVLNLEPNETKKILFKFSIKYPKNKRGLVKQYNTLKNPRYF